MNNASRGYCLSTIRGHIENNLNNFYNKLQRFAGTLPLRGPCKPKVACSETTIYNASPGQSAGNSQGENVSFMVPFLAMITVSDLLLVRYARRQQRDRR